MKILIIEDERLTAQDLQQVILDVEPDAEIVAILSSVKQAKAYLLAHPAPDLIFSDIQLGDGLSFDIFEQVNVRSPIIFCTAYDEYALDAFKSKGIDYILKPFTPDAIRASLDKYRDLAKAFTDNSELIEQLKSLMITSHRPRASSLLVNYKEKIIPIRIDDVALFYIENQATYLMLFSGQSYFVNKTLDQLQHLSGDRFFRVNRQHLVNRDAIKDASHHLSRKLSVTLNVPFSQSITLGKEKLGEFINWLGAY